jgi:hypothetical protein
LIVDLVKKGRGSQEKVEQNEFYQKDDQTSIPLDLFDLPGESLSSSYQHAAECPSYLMV